MLSEIVIFKYENHDSENITILANGWYNPISFVPIGPQIPPWYYLNKATISISLTRKGIRRGGITQMKSLILQSDVITISMSLLSLDVSIRGTYYSWLKNPG